MRSNASSAVLAITACVLWSTAFAFVKIGLDYVPPLYFAGLRFTLAGLFLLPFWVRREGSLKIVSSHLRFIMLVGLLQTVIQYTLFFIALQFIDGALGAIIIGSSPLVAAILSHMFMHNDRMSIRSALSLAVGIAGIVIISLSREPWTSAGMREFIGVLLILGTSVASTFSNILVAKDKKNINPIMLSSSQMIFGGIVLLLVSLPAEGVTGFVHPVEFYLSLLWLSFISATGFSIWYLLLKRPGVTVSGLNVWMFIIPVFGAVFSWSIIPEEQPTVYALVGMGCVAFSLITYNRIKGIARLTV